MKSNVIELEKAIKKGSFIELTGKRAEEVSMYWKVEILKGENRQLQEVNYAIRLTSTLDEVSVTFSKADMEDNAQSKKIVKRLSGFGIIKTSYLKAITESVNEALYTQPDKIITVSDISSVWTSNILSGVPAERYYRTFYQHFKENPHLFPTRSSNEYKHNISHGVILDNKRAKRGEFLVAIKSGELKELFSISNDQHYREVLASLVIMGVLEGELQEREVEVVEELDGFDEDDNYEYVAHKNVKTIIKTKKVRIDKRITMNTKGQEANVFIFNIDPEKGE